MDSRIEKGVKSFSSIKYQCPEIQRGIVQEAVDAIYKRESDYYIKHNRYAVPGVISMAICDGIEYVIDGQHRMMAYRRLSKEHPENQLMVTIDYYHCENTASMEAAYKLVNTCTPNDISRMSVDTYKIKQETMKFFKDKFPIYVKTTTKPNAPNINIDHLGEKLDKVDLSNFRLGEFVKLTIDLNIYYSTCSPEQFKKWHVDAKKIDVIKQQGNQLFLGLYRCYEWVDMIVLLVKMRTDNPEKLVTFADMEHMNSAYRIPITKVLRRNVWSCTQTEQPCFCCKDTISYDNFECGHIISVAMGGATVLSNLKPVCGPCNNQMGTRNMLDYCKSIEDQLV